MHMYLYIYITDHMPNSHTWYETGLTQSKGMPKHGAASAVSAMRAGRERCHTLFLKETAAKDALKRGAGS